MLTRDYSKLRVSEKAWSNKTAWRLFLVNWRLCHQIVELRDGYKCIICGRQEDLDLDHGITRGRKILFLDIRHLGYLCKTHHTHKSKRKGDWVDKEVDQVHIKREGKKVWEDILSKSRKDNPAWRTVWYQELKNIFLKEQLEYFKLRTE